MSRKSSRPTPAERAEIARLLPVPADRDLFPGRHRLLKAHLLDEIQKGTGASSFSRRSGRRLAFVLAPVVAGAMAAALAIGALPGRQHTAPRNDAAAGRHALPADSTEVGTSITGGAVRLLDRIATVAADKPLSTVRDDQYVYIKSLEAFVVPEGHAPAGARRTLEKPHPRQVWMSVDGSRPGLLRGEGCPPGGTSLGTNPHPYLNAPTYRYLESLPTDPGLLLKKIYKDTKGAGPSPDEEAFITIGDALREQIAPPEVSAALYRAAAKIPGVTVVDDVVDAAGRHGIAVAFLQAGGERTEWIFDKKTLALLGERSVMTKNTAGTKAGQVTVTIAILDRAIVDEPGQAPSASAA
ncbi:CU044_5270 family protein [Streptomyces sp. NPDC047022]|uniref:CU044_5270 family protein n=1 Tax=Streptomyces sp. NPDC047022 TaxID=3155737 RepID=UPI0033D48E97